MLKKEKLPIFTKKYNMTAFNHKLLDEISGRISDVEVLNILRTQKIDWNYVAIIKEYTNLKDDLISDWLNISVKTFRNYKSNQEVVLRENTQEHVVLLISLFKHGIEVFGTQKDFDKWLTTNNLYLDNDTPMNYLKTISGIRLIEDRLTAIEYGDNV